MTDVKKFRPYLGKDEVILWSGQPKQGLLLRAHDILLIPLSIMLTYFFVSVLSNVIDGSGSVNAFTALIITLFSSFFLYLLLVRFILDIIRRKKIYYAVTNYKIMIYPGDYGNDMRRIKFENLEALRLQKRLGNTGSIIFSRPKLRPWWYRFLRKNLISKLRVLAGYDKIIKFDTIDDVEKVYEIIKNERFPFLAKLDSSEDI